MRKLRLIKPWKLRAVKQRMQDHAVRDSFGYMPCYAPDGNLIERYDVGEAIAVVKMRVGNPHRKRKTMKGPK